MPKALTKFYLLILILGATTSSMAQSMFDQRQEQPLFMALSGKDPELIASVSAAQGSLAHFRKLLSTIKNPDAPPLVKSHFSEGRGVWLWLALVEPREDGFLAEVFEAPPEFPTLNVGARRFIPSAQIADWMILEKGTLHGGYSIRLQRTKIPESERASFDKYIGAERYAPLAH